MQRVHSVQIKVDRILFLFVSPRTTSSPEMAQSVTTFTHSAALNPQSLCNLPHRLLLRVVVHEMNVISDHVAVAVMEIAERGKGTLCTLGLLFRLQIRPQIQALDEAVNGSAVGVASAFFVK